MTHPKNENDQPELMNGPIFIVGCSRSGTTLAHSLLCSGGEVFAFPETNVLYHLADDLDSRRFGSLSGQKNIPKIAIKKAFNKFGITLHFSWDPLKHHLPKNLREHLRTGKKPRRWRMSTALNDFELMMESASGGFRWTEKTPQNIFVLEIIENYFKNAKFIHTLRDPIENVASLIDAARKYESFQSRFGGPDGVEKAIIYCKHSQEISLSRPPSEKHFHLQYEDLTSNPNKTLRKLEKFAGLNPNSLKARYETDGIVKPGEEWKNYNSSITPSLKKAHKILSKEQKERVEKEFQVYWSE